MKRSGNSGGGDGGGGDDNDAYAWPIASSLFSFSFLVKTKTPPRLFYILTSRSLFHQNQSLVHV